MQRPVPPSAPLLRRPPYVWLLRLRSLSSCLPWSEAQVGSIDNVHALPGSHAVSCAALAGCDDDSVQPITPQCVLLALTVSEAMCHVLGSALASVVLCISKAEVMTATALAPCAAQANKLLHRQSVPAERTDCQ